MTATLLSETDQRASSAAQRLRTASAAVRVSLHWLGVRKTLTPEQKSQAAVLSASKKGTICATMRCAVAIAE